MQQNNLSVIILAAGLGSRMKSSLSKGMHLLGNATLLDHAINNALKLNPQEIAIVLASSMASEKAHIEKHYIKTNVKFAVCFQKEQKGTANAVLGAKDAVKINNDTTVLVLYVDTPLVMHETLNNLVSLVQNKQASIALLGFNATVPNAYGKIIVNNNNNVAQIIENSEATHVQKQVTLSNSGIMAFEGKHMWNILEKIDNNNSKKEHYLTDSIGIANAQNLVCKYIVGTASELEGANTKAELATLEHLFQHIKRKEFLEQGVQMIDPNTVYFSLDTKIAQDVIIYPNVYIFSGVTIESGSVILPFCSLEGAHIKSNVSVGPFARLRKGTVLENDVHVGNFVEVKNSTINEHTKAGHLAYIGDTTIGKKTNIGAGVITCNYDGVNKHHTNIGEHSFIGSNSALVAPVNIGNNVTIAAGSTITADVPNKTLAIARSRQINKDGWVKKS